MFQFQTGSIKRGVTFTASMRLLSFNSKLVRLKVVLILHTQQDLPSFNSKLVRLKVIYISAVSEDLINVSIPNWFD